MRGKQPQALGQKQKTDHLPAQQEGSRYSEARSDYMWELGPILGGLQITWHILLLLSTWRQGFGRGWGEGSETQSSQLSAHAASSPFKIAHTTGPKCPTMGHLCHSFRTITTVVAMLDKKPLLSFLVSRSGHILVSGICYKAKLRPLMHTPSSLR